MSSTRPQLALSELLGLGITLLHSGWVALLTTFTGPFRGNEGNRSLYWHVVHAVFRSYNLRTSPQQKHSVFPPTDVAYETFAKVKGFKPKTLSLPHGARLHTVVGDQDAEHLLIWFHGGAFVYPAAMQFDVFWSLKDDIPPKSAIALLSYSLATTGALYPTQLRQAAGCLEYLIGPGGKKAENILIGGDSAGGNLCASLLSHLVHPHPDIAPVQLNRPLAGAALVSPWGNFAHDADAYTRNQYKDSWDAPALSKCAEVYLGDAKPDEWNQPFRAKAEWWTDISSKVRDILITGGSEEVMADDITAFAKKIEVNHSSTTTTVVSGEVHDQAFMDPLFFDNRQAASTKLFKEWVKARL